ncbi:MAG: hypothetical protein KBT48_06190 [Firmicutes bacterium]|nr:hypothetical protein [Bacillota bacterium]
MKQRMIYSSCPHCGHDFQILRDTYEIADMNPTLEERLQNDSYFLHQCNACKKLYYLQYPFMYRNPKKKYILLYSQQESLPKFSKEEKVIRVKHAKQFTFAYKVLKYDLEIKKVLSIQNRLKNMYKEEVKFESFQDNTLWFQIQGEYIGVPYQ